MKMDEAVLKPVLNILKPYYRCIANSEPDESAFTLPAYGQTRKIYKNHIESPCDSEGDIPQQQLFADFGTGVRRVQ
jgi:hypothetical protein